MIQGSQFVPAVERDAPALLLGFAAGAPGLLAAGAGAKRPVACFNAVAQRYSQVSMEGQNNQANTRLLSPAVEPLEPSKPKIALGIAGSILGGLAAGILAAIGLEMMNRRIRMPEDMIVMAGVPVIGLRGTDAPRHLRRAGAFKIISRLSQIES